MGDGKEGGGNDRGNTGNEEGGDDSGSEEDGDDSGSEEEGGDNSGSDEDVIKEGAKWQLQLWHGLRDRIACDGFLIFFPY